ncbi:MAG: ABC transporter substrate-binding protein [Myxococcota bacterium]
MKTGWTSALLVAVLVGACQQASDDHINLVAVLPLSGSFASRGEIHKAAIQMALEDIRQERPGGILGRGFRVHLADASDGEDLAAERVRAIVDNKGSANIAGIISSTGAAQAGSLPIALEYGIPHFEISAGDAWDELIATDDPLHANIGFALSTRATCYNLAVMAAEFIAQNETAWPRVALVRGNKAHDKMHIRTIRSTLTAMQQTGTYHGTIVNDEAHEEIPYGDSYEASIAGLATTYDPPPDVIFWHLRGDDHNTRFMQDAKRVSQNQSYSPELVTCGMSRTNYLLDATATGPSVVDYLGGRFWFAMRGPMTDGERLSNFTQAFTAFHGEAPDTWAASAYDAAMLLALGIAQADSTEGATVRDAIVAISHTGTQVSYGETRRALALIGQGVDIDYDGASGTLDIDTASGRVPGRYYVEAMDFTPGSASGAYRVLETPAPQVLF